MPRQQGLLQRGSRWYSHFEVPTDLVEALGKKKICQSLGTSDYREACHKVKVEMHCWEVDLKPRGGSSSDSIRRPVRNSAF